MRLPARLFAAVCLLFALPAHAQTDAANTPAGAIVSFFAHWDERALNAQLNQPNWLTPVITSTARLKQEIRYDISWQRNPDGTTAENYGGSKGFTTIPIDRVEISINFPPYMAHNEPKVQRRVRRLFDSDEVPHPGPQPRKRRLCLDGISGRQLPHRFL